MRRAANRRRYKGFRCASKSVSKAGSTMQETAPTEGGLLTGDETTTVGTEGAWRWDTIVYYSATLHTAGGLHGSSSRRRRYAPRSTPRSLVVASLGCGAARVVRPRAVAGEYSAKGSSMLRRPTMNTDARWECSCRMPS